MNRVSRRQDSQLLPQPWSSIGAGSKNAATLADYIGVFTFTSNGDSMSVEFPHRVNGNTDARYDQYNILIEPPGPRFSVILPLAGEE